MSTTWIVGIGLIPLFCLGLLLLWLFRKSVPWKTVLWVAGITVFMVFFYRGCTGCISSSSKNKNTDNAPPTASPIPRRPAVSNTTVTDDPEYPRAGSGFATKENGIKCWLDPMKTFVRPLKPVRYVVADHPKIFIDDHLDRRNDKTWYRMPAGKYIIYPLNSKEGEEVYVRWWH